MITKNIFVLLSRYNINDYSIYYLTHLNTSHSKNDIPSILNYPNHNRIGQLTWENHSERHRDNDLLADIKFDTIIFINRITVCENIKFGNFYKYNGNAISTYENKKLKNTKYLYTQGICIKSLKDKLIND